MDGKMSVTYIDKVCSNIITQVWVIFSAVQVCWLTIVMRHNQSNKTLVLTAVTLFVMQAISVRDHQSLLRSLDHVLTILKAGFRRDHDTVGYSVKSFKNCIRD